MKSHLSPQEFAEAVDGALAPARAAHLDVCDTCRGEMAALRIVMRDVRTAATIPEPSPLFWNHLSRRVHEATRVEATPARSWWHAAWQPLVAIGAVTAVAVLATLELMPKQPAVAPVTTIETAAAPDTLDAAGDDESFDFVARIAAAIPFEELQVTARPTRDAADAMVDQLTSSQRAELVRLLKEKIGGAE